MIIFKIVIYSMILFSSVKIGQLIASKYTIRVKELYDFHNSLNIFKTKIKFTYEPLPEIFREISQLLNSNIKDVYNNSIKNMQIMSAGTAWEEALIKTDNLEINNEDKEILIKLGKLLGKTDLQGQISEIEVTISLLEIQIKKAEEIKNKDVKLYKTLGTIIGIGLIIILL